MYGSVHKVFPTLKSLIWCMDQDWQLNLFAGLQSGADGDILRDGARGLQEEAMRHHPAQAALDRKCIQDKVPDDEAGS